jgi:NADH-quinone oxidoreductase subunit I
MIALLIQIVRGVKGLIVGHAVTMMENIRTNVKRPVTYQYGYAPRWSKLEARPIAPRYRGRFVLLRNPETGAAKCVGCKLCAQACPGKCIEVGAENKQVTSYRMHIDQCLFCGMCVEACPFEALGMAQDPMPVQTTHACLVLEMGDLLQGEAEPAPGVMPTTAGGDLRPGKKAPAPKPALKAQPGTAAEVV